MLLLLSRTRYELQPGFELSITRADAGLVIQIPPDIHSSLTAESEDTFADDDTDGAGTFQRDAQGSPPPERQSRQPGQVMFRATMLRSAA
jgi:hypothetical protein